MISIGFVKVKTKQKKNERQRAREREGEEKKQKLSRVESFRSVHNITNIIVSMLIIVHRARCCYTIVYDWIWFRWGIKKVKIVSFRYFFFSVFVFSFPSTAWLSSSSSFDSFEIFLLFCVKEKKTFNYVLEGNLENIKLRNSIEWMRSIRKLKIKPLPRNSVE